MQFSTIANIVALSCAAALVSAAPIPVQIQEHLIEKRGAGTALNLANTAVGLF